MGLLTQFNIDENDIGKIRKKFVQSVEKDLGGILDYQTIFAPIVQESDKAGKASRFLKGKSKEEQTKERYIMLSAKVQNQAFQNLVCFLSPIPMSGGFSNVFLEEYTYTTIIPYPVDSTVFYVEKRGALGGKKGFFVLPEFQPFDQEISEEIVFNPQLGVALSMAQEIQKLRSQLSMSNDVKNIISRGITSFVSAHLNLSPQLPKMIKDLKSLPEAGKMGVKISNAIGVTTIIIPNGKSSIVQIGEFSLKPKRALNILNGLSEELRIAYEQYQSQNQPMTTPTTSEVVFCKNCGTQGVMGQKYCKSCGGQL